MHMKSIFKVILMLVILAGAGYIVTQPASGQTEQPDGPGTANRHRRTATPRPTNTPFAPPSATATRTQAPAPTVAPSATPGTNYHFPSPQVVAAEAEMLQIINNHRASLGYPALSRVVTLDLAQRDWAVQMVLSNQCYHGDYGARALSEGYTQFVWGEVGACGHTAAQGAFQGWMNSPAHKAILEECCEMNDVGIGAWRYPNGAYTFWVVLADRD